MITTNMSFTTRSTLVKFIIIVKLITEVDK